MQSQLKQILIVLICPLLFYSCKTKIDAEEQVLNLVNTYHDWLCNPCLSKGEEPEMAELFCELAQNNPHYLQLEQLFQDSLYRELIEIEKEDILNSSTLIQYLILKEELECAIELRICKKYLWNINPKDGVHMELLGMMERQSFERDIDKKSALKKWEYVPQYIQTEIANLKEGIAEGYAMPKDVVRIVISQLTSMLIKDEIEAVFLEPAYRTEDKAFIRKWHKLIVEKLEPALKSYHDFLKYYYLKVARDRAAILALPEGRKCYEAFVRRYTSLPLSGEEIYNYGSLLVEKNTSEVIELGRDLYGSEDFETIMYQIRQEGKRCFTTRNELLNYCNSIICKAKWQCQFWFKEVPESQLVIEPYKGIVSGAGELVPGVDGSASSFKINIPYQLNETRTDCEILVYHETFPGHLLQMSIAGVSNENNLLSNDIEYDVYEEGWARYAEELADEMGLYSSKKANIERKAWIGRAMTIDVGVNLYGWTREDVVKYVEELGIDKKVGTGLYLRSIFWPAQLISYDLGGEEFKTLRLQAEKELGPKFDIKEFHVKLLENGSVPLKVLRNNIELWIANTK